MLCVRGTRRAEAKMEAKRPQRRCRAGPREEDGIENDDEDDDDDEKSQGRFPAIRGPARLLAPEGAEGGAEVVLAVVEEVLDAEGEEGDDPVARHGDEGPGDEGELPVGDRHED